MKDHGYQIDMCSGPLFSKIVLFSLPLMLTFILQMLFNAVDLMVIGHYASYKSMAAIGATLNMNSLLLNVFIGISVGSNVIMSRAFGAGGKEGMRRALHSSMAFAIYGGIVLTVLALATAKPLLVLMATPEDILPLSCIYIWICFAGIPFIMIYNFGCAVLRAVGDTRRPLYFLTIAGCANVMLNLFFVVGCGMDVGGVAVATVISHAISAALILYALLKGEGELKLVLKDLNIHGPTFREMLNIGVPAGVQSSLFAISNMLIQSSVNSFGALAIAGNTATLGLEGVVYIGSFAFHQTAISFVAQNLGGGKFSRIAKSLWMCAVCAVVSCIILGWGFYLAGAFVLKAFNPDPEVIRWGIIRMKVLFTTYLLCGLMDVASGGLRGLGYSLLSTLVSLVGACGFRVWWVLAVFPHYRTMENLMLSYPISWALVALISGSSLVWLFRRTVRHGIRRKSSWDTTRPVVPRGLRFIGRSK